MSPRSKMPRPHQRTASELIKGVVCFVVAAVAASVAPACAQAFDARSIEPSVYKIYSFVPEKGGQYSISSGTGFLVSGRRRVVTNVHVVEGGQRIYIAFRDGGDAKLVEAELTDRSPDVDLARLDARADLPGTPLEVGEFEPDKLADVIAIGFPGAANLNKELVPETDARGVPLTDLEATVTTGVVSRMTFSHLKLTNDQVLSARTVQHNAAINPGSSGGPLLDACGQVVGVNTLQGVNAQGVFFSIHAAELARFLRTAKVSFGSNARGCSTSILAGTLMPLVAALAASLGLAAFFFTRVGSRQAIAEAVASVLAHVPKLSQARDAVGSIIRTRREAASVPLLCLRPSDGTPAIRLDPTGRARTIGRGPGADIAVRDDTVSKIHAQLVYDREKRTVGISDLGSSNGTYLNGRRIPVSQEVEARLGTRVRLGTMELVVAEETVADEATRGWMLSGFDASGCALQFELKPTLDADGHVLPAVWTVGRDPLRADLVIEDPSVSSTHAEISFQPSQSMRLRDLDSMNGTRVDGENIAEREVALETVGQEIAFGLARFRLSRLTT